MRCIILQRKFGSWGGGPLARLFQSVFLITPINIRTWKMGNVAGGEAGVSEKLQSINRCSHTEMETVECKGVQLLP